MTEEDVKKRLECVARITGNDIFVDAYKIITEQEKEIEQLKIERGKRLTCDFVKTVQKQAQIDVLNRLKRIMTAYSWQIGINDVQKEIDELIKEIEEQ